MLGGIAVAYHGLLDLHGLVLIHGHTRLLDCQQNDAPGLSNLNAGCDIVAKEQLLNGHGIGLGQLHELCHVVVDLPQTPVEVRV